VTSLNIIKIKEDSIGYRGTQFPIDYNKSMDGPETAKKVSLKKIKKKEEFLMKKLETLERSFKRLD
jgi:hypothetical protein